MAYSPSSSYGDDLSYIHDSGFGHVAQNAAAHLVKLLRRDRKKRPHHLRVVDLGCGSGILAHAMATAGYDVLGYDLSDSMLALAARREPRAEFRRESFVTAELPPCLAVTAIGEVFNYLFDRRNRGNRLPAVIRRVYQALCPGGVFLFDLAGPGRVPGSGPQRAFSEGPGWACLYSAEEDRRRKTLTRTITAFRKIGESYRRSREVHRLRLYDPAEVLEHLRSVGFRAHTVRNYGRFRFPVGWIGFAARKPGISVTVRVPRASPS